MFITTNQLLEQLHDYANPFGKISRMVKKEELVPITKGLYETEKNISGFYLAGAIYGPSYISFNTALSYYEMIPEAVYAFCSATCGKLKKKEYRNAFGTFTYRDIPSEAFRYGIKIIKEGEYYFRIATLEKALCDKLYDSPIIKSIKDMERFLFIDLRIDEDIFNTLNREDIYFLSKKYHSSNIYLLAKLLRRKYHE